MATIEVTEHELIEIEAAPIPHARLDPIAVAADKGGYKPDCSLLELNQAIRVIQQYHVLQRERQAKIKARLDMIKSMS